MTKPQRFLNRVIVFLVLAALVVGAMFPVVWTAFLHNVFLNGLILAVLLAGIVYNLRRIIRLRTEIGWIETVQTMGTGATLKNPPRLLGPVAQVLGEQHRRGRMLSAPSLRHLLDGISARLDESRDIARYETGLLIFLGLLGTFWGLLQAINAIGGVIGGLTIGGGDFVTLFNEMKAGLSRPLGGMGTAFSSSLFGLAGSLILGFLDLQATQAQNSFYNDLEDWLTGLTRHAVADAGLPEIGSGGPPIPVYVQALLQQTAENLDRLQGAMASSEDTQRHLHHSLHELNDRLSMLGDRLMREQEMLGRLIDGQQVIAEHLARPAAVLDEATRNHIRNTDVQIARLAEDMARGRTEMAREIKSEIKLVARTIAIAAGDPQLVRD
ncbi:flagellar motor protein MotA [Marinimicrococcus flavescens]|uniref:Flagellar motor protein MotA n=1 Tax=Marinimicrococcus flavescens TaxID=3031815 RepID=A0AAP4D7H3_9PROT|nr:flagellar motor protein MotA [Marinimicrococcus flavescens]